MAMFEVDDSSGLPVWVQLRNRIVYLIKTGVYRSGDQLPSVRSLAAEASINYNTVSKVYVDLERDGYVKAVRGRGVFVCDREVGEREDTLAVVDAIIEEAVQRCLALGVPLDEVRRRAEGVCARFDWPGGPDGGKRDSCEGR